MATEQNGGEGEARDYTLSKKDLKSVQKKKRNLDQTKLFTHPKPKSSLV